MPSSAIAAASAGASSGKPGLSSNLGVLANISSSPRAGRLTAAGDSFGRRFGPFQNERREERGLPSSPLCLRSAGDLVRAAPLWERSLSDRSYFALSVIVGMTWTYLRPSLPS